MLLLCDEVLKIAADPEFFIEEGAGSEHLSSDCDVNDKDLKMKYSRGLDVLENFSKYSVSVAIKCQLCSIGPPE